MVRAASSTDEIVRTLSGAGVPCEPVVRAHEHDRLPPVVARGLFEPVEHPVTGAADYIGAPFRFTRGPRVGTTARARRSSASTTATCSPVSSV